MKFLPEVVGLVAVAAVAAAAGASVRVVQSGTWWEPAIQQPVAVNSPPLSTVFVGSANADSIWDFAWFDIAASPGAKKVAVRLSFDKGLTFSTVFAGYQRYDFRSLSDIWHLELQVGSRKSLQEPLDEVTYSVYAYYGDNSGTVFDSEGDHFLLAPITAENPIRVLLNPSISTTLQVDSTISIEGLIRVWGKDVRTIGSDNRVNVRYTSDDWKTISEVEAKYWIGHDFKYSITGLKGTSGDPKILPDVVQFAAQLHDVYNKEHWDRNHGENYQIRISPEFQGTVPPEKSIISGTIKLFAVWNTNVSDIVCFAKVAADGTLRDDRWIQGNPFTLDTSKFKNGNISVNFRALLFGKVVFERTVSYVIQNEFQLEKVVVPKTIKLLDSWKFHQDFLHDEIYYFSTGGLRFTQSNVVWYNSSSNVAEQIRLPKPGEVLLDSYDKVSYLRNGLLFYPISLPDGSLIANPPFDLSSLAFCNMGDIVFSKDHVFLADTCGYKVIRFSKRSRTVDGEITLKPETDKFPTGLFIDSKGLWVIDAARIVLYDPSTLSIVRNLVPSALLPGSKGLVRQESSNGEELFWTTNSQAVYVLTPKASGDQESLTAIQTFQNEKYLIVDIQRAPNDCVFVYDLESGAIFKMSRAAASS